jgi:hypothetical protein
MTTRQPTALRQRMLDDMRLRNMADGTRRSYVRSVAGFSAFHGSSPDERPASRSRARPTPCRPSPPARRRSERQRRTCRGASPSLSADLTGRGGTRSRPRGFDR